MAVRAKYLFPITHLKREDLQGYMAASGKNFILPENVPFFEVRVPSRYNPFLVRKGDDEIAKLWRDEGYEVEEVEEVLD